MYVTLEIEPTLPEDQSALKGLSGLIRGTNLTAGRYLFREGDEVRWLYLVKSGVLRLTRLLENGRRQVIAFGYPNDIVGFPCSGFHHTDCDALTDVQLSPIPKSALEKGDCDPQLHNDLMQATLREISAMQDHFMMLGRKSAVEKMASFLTVLTTRFGSPKGENRKVTLPMARADIADFLGLTTETVSRTLTQLRKSKIIKIENIHTIIVLRPTALAVLSRGEGD